MEVVINLSKNGAAAEQKLEDEAIEVLKSLEMVGIEAAIHELVKALRQAAEFLKEVLIIVAKQELIKASHQAEESIKKINEALNRLEQR